MADLILTASVFTCVGFVIGIIACFYRDQSGIAIVKESRDYYRTLYEAACEDVNRANAERFAAEETAAVAYVQAIVTGRAAS
jgi:hypothetical protein